MIWNRVDQCHWRCEDYKDGYAIEVKPRGKGYQYSVLFNDNKLKNGRQPQAMTCMKVSMTVIDKHLRTKNDKN